MNFCDLAELMRETLGQEEARRVCLVIAQRFAGETVYIPARPIPPEILPNDTPASVARRYRVDRSTGYRWVDKWRR